MERQNIRKVLICALGILIACLQSPAHSSSEEGTLFDFSSDDPALFRAENEAIVEVSKEGLKMDFSGGNYPGVDLGNGVEEKDLSAFRAMEADVVNESGFVVTACLRVDNPGDWQSSPWSVAMVKIPPGDTLTIRTNFGEAYGQPGFALDPARIVRIKLYVDSPLEKGAIRLTSLRAVK